MYRSVSSLCDDPLRNKLNMYEVPSKFNGFLKNRGVKFEQLVFKKISKKVPIVKIDRPTDYKNMQMAFFKTIEEINNKTPVIYQGVLQDDTNKIRGIPDFIVRADYLKYIFNTIDIKGSNLDNYYSIVEIKWTTIGLRVNNKKYLKNELLKNITNLRISFQVALYNKLLVRHCKVITLGIVIGKRYKKGKKIIINPLGCFGIVNLNKDNIIELFKKNKTGLKYKTDMSEKIKSYIESTSDLSQIWNVGKRQKEYAFKKNILSWRDSRCNSKVFKIKNKQRAKIIDLMIKINRNDDDSNFLLYHPRVLINGDAENKIVFKSAGTGELSNAINLVQYTSITEDRIYYIEMPKLNMSTIDGDLLFIDIETVNNSLYEEVSFINKESKITVFMVGVGTFTNSKWDFVSMVSESLSEEDEYNLIDSFFKYVDTLTKNPIFVHWGHYEYSFFKKKLKNNDKYSKYLSEDKWLDMYKDIFIKYGILVKGQFNFSLKTVYDSFVAAKLITDRKRSLNPICTATDAVFNAIMFYKNGSMESLFNVCVYNHLDCVMMGDIFLCLLKKFS